MIGFLRGKVFEMQDGRLLLDVNGVGYEIFMPERDMMKLPQQGEDAFVHVHTVFRDDSISLYGFSSQERRRIFLLLLDVSGVGPKLALNVLSGVSCRELLAALAQGQTSLLQSIHGVGKKTAARLCVDLRDRAARMLEEAGFERDQGHEVEDARPISGSQLEADALSALVNLGWKERHAASAIKDAMDELGGKATLQQVITSAMSRLSRLAGQGNTEQ